MKKGKFSFAYFFVLVSFLGFFSGIAVVSQAFAAQSVGATFSRAKLEKRSKAVEQSLEKGKTEPVVEGEAAVVDQAAAERERLEKEDLRSRVIS